MAFWKRAEFSSTGVHRDAELTLRLTDLAGRAARGRVTVLREVMHPDYRTHVKFELVVLRDDDDDNDDD